jgi:5-methylcytosine-specific restriction endonuclease McrA
MGRPRETNVSDWAHWKREQRASPGGKTGKGKCSICGKTAQLAVDHKDNVQSNASASNKQRICQSCHGKKTQLRDLALRKRAGAGKSKRNASRGNSKR